MGLHVGDYVCHRKEVIKDIVIFVAASKNIDTNGVSEATFCVVVLQHFCGDRSWEGREYKVSKGIAKTKVSLSAPL